MKSYQHEHAVSFIIAETLEDRGRKEVETSLQFKLKKVIVKNKGLNLFKINLAIWIKLILTQSAYVCMHAICLVNLFLFFFPMASLSSGKLHERDFYASITFCMYYSASKYNCVRKQQDEHSAFPAASVPNSLSTAYQ